MTHFPVADVNLSRKPEKGRIIGAEINIAEIAQNEFQAGKHLRLRVRMFATAKVLDLGWVAPTILTRGDFSYFERTVAQRTMSFVH